MSNTTKEQAILLVAKAIETGKVLQAKAYNSNGVLTIRPANKAVGPSCYAAYWYKPYHGSCKGSSLETAYWFVERVGSVMAGKVARKELE